MTMEKKQMGPGVFVAILSAALIGSIMGLSGVSNAAAQEALNDRFSVRWDTEGRVSRDIVESATAPGGAVLEVGVRRRTTPEVWRTRVTVPLVKDINAGDEIELRVWIRAESPIRSLETANLDLQIVRTSEPYDYVFSENVRPTDEGQYYTVRGVADADFDADDVVFGANLGYGRQTIHFGPIFINRINSAE